MADLTGEADKGALRLDFDRRIAVLKALKGAILTPRNRRKLANVGLRLFAIRGQDFPIT